VKRTYVGMDRLLSFSVVSLFFFFFSPGLRPATSRHARPSEINDTLPFFPPFSLFFFPLVTFDGVASRASGVKAPPDLPGFFPSSLNSFLAEASRVGIAEVRGNSAVAGLSFFFFFFFRHFFLSSAGAAARCEGQ